MAGLPPGVILVSARLTVYVGGLYEERAGQRLCHVYAGGRRIATFEPQSTVCQALGLPAKWDGRLERLGRALTWPLRHGYQPVVMLALTLLGVLALVVGPAARRSVLRLGGASSREPWSPGAPWAWLTRLLPTYRRLRRPSPYDEAPLVLATARSWWQRAVAAVTMAALVMAQTPARAESPLPAGCFYYHLADHLGSSNVVTYRDGLQAQHFENGVFGREVHEQHATTHQLSARYTGQLFDEETGLYYYGARYYDPELGRFTQADTLVPDPGDGQSLNRYSYANNNPLKYTDPTGHEPISILATLLITVAKGFAVGASLGALYAAATGGNVGQSALFGAISGGLIALGGVAGGALAGAITASMNGRDAGDGALIGALTTAITFGVAYGAETYLLNTIANQTLRTLAAASIASVTAGGVAELSGGSFAEGALFSLGLSAANWISGEARQWMIKDSRKDPRNASGESSNFWKDDYDKEFKLGGNRYDPARPRDQQRQAELGGLQGGPGLIGRPERSIFGVRLGWHYKPGSFSDHLIEAYSGLHDGANSPLGYDPATGNLRANRSFAMRMTLDVANVVNVALVTPFALPSLLTAYSPWPIVSAQVDNQFWNFQKR